jgi:soluble lytic murein transglycosylase-like protein
MIRILVAAAALVVAQPAVSQERSRAEIDALVVKHASANGVPEALVRRVIMRESRYRAGIVGRGGTMGLMQIKHATARGVGYAGSADGLLDPDTNLTYGVRYLAGAYRAAGGNADRAVSYYASGYYQHAKRKGLTARTVAQAPAAAIEPEAAAAESVVEVVAEAAPEPTSAVSPADRDFPH